MAQATDLVAATVSPITPEPIAYNLGKTTISLDHRSSLDQDVGIRGTSDSAPNISSLLRKFEKDAGNWIQESPTEAAIRSRGLRKITFALFALGISLTCFLNSRLLLQGVELQQLIVCNLGIMVVYVLAGILLFHDMTFKRKTGFRKEVVGVVKRIEIVAGQIEELDALRFKMLCSHKEMVANQRDLLHAMDALATENIRESEKALEAQELIALAQAQLSKTQAAIADETTKFDRIQHAVTTLESEFQAVRLDHSNSLANQQSEMERLKAQQNQCLAVTEQNIAAACQAEETAQAIRDNLAHLQAELQSIEIEKTASVESHELLKLELLDMEKNLSESNLTLTMTQDECEKVTAALTIQQEAHKAIQEKRSLFLIEIELLESEKAASQSSLASSKLELACVELEFIRMQAFVAEQPLLMQASAELEQLNATINSVEQSICDMEQERSSLQRKIEYANAMEADATNRLATLNEQVSKLESDRVGLSESIERLLSEIEEKSGVHDGLCNQNMSATASLEGLLDSVEQLSRKEADLLSACISAEQKMGDWTTNAESLVTRVNELTVQITTVEEQRLHAIEGLENLLGEIDLKSADRTTIADSIEKLTQQMSDLDAMALVAQTRLELAEAATKQTESVLEDTTNKLGTYEVQLSRASESCLAQQAELSRLQHDLQAEQRLLAQIQSEIADKRQDRIAAESELVDLQKLTKETQVACDDANAELGRFIMQIDTMSEQLMIKEEQSRDVNAKLVQLSELEDELKFKLQKRDELEKQLNQSESSCEAAREHLTKLQADARNVQLELDRLDRKESELTLKSNKMHAENEQLDANYDLSNRKLQSVQHELLTLQMKRAQLESEIQASEQRKLEIQRTMDGFASEADEAQTVCKQWADYGAKLRNDNKEVESEIAKLRLEFNELRVEQDRSLQEKQAVSAGLSTLKGQRDTLNTEIANRRDFLLELKVEQTQVVKQVAANNNCLEQTQADLDRLASECNFATLELDGLHDQRRFENSCVQELAIQREQLHGEVHGLTQVLEKLRADAVDQEQKHLDKIRSLQAEAEGSRVQIDSLQQQLKDAEFELDENRESVKRLNSKLEATRNDCQHAGQLLLESQNKTQEVVRSIADREKELAETDQAIRGKHLQSQSLDLELFERNTFLETIQQTLVDTESKTTEQQTRLGQVQEAVESLRSQAVALECDLVERAGRKAEADASIAVAASHSKDLQNLIEALESEKRSLLQVLETEKTQLDTALHERTQLKSANRQLEVSNDNMLQTIRGLHSQRDDLAKLVSDLNSEIGLNKNYASQLQTQIEASSAQIAQVEQSRREWMEKESTTIDQVARMRAELENLESQQLQAKQALEARVVPTHRVPKTVLYRRAVELLPKEAEVTESTTVELAQEILEEISDLASFDNTIVGRDDQTNESDLAETSQKEPSEDPWSVVLK